MQIIEKFNVRFDENLSMGEDLRFSVEYFEKSDTEFVYAFSAHLYHYTKLSENTLMSDFARGNAEDAVKRLQMIKNVALKYNKRANENYETALKRLKNNYTYFWIRDRRLSICEQYRKIKSFSPEYCIINFCIDKARYL